ncbi:T9SS type A sorting domain-containing protein [Xanthomarina sp. F2636L]|uniref:T9SS type A sorting domain-containing protein n=1 Tax=Xanthomarina sp. F2636L TaxID=2996018 RepID=UPI00225DE891|nr:T9SS type A sorting domain-containing protein [Xanthomarina sp. F2636L]MCX7551238.1 T9SS type A sorting domain-containing protein [Xanthomarina sp. F2636L]
MKKLLLFIAILFSVGVTAQITFDATQPYINSMYGAGKFITINSATGERAVLIAGKNTNVSGENGSTKLFAIDGTELFDFNLESIGSKVSFFEENNYIYIAIITKDYGKKVFRALMDGNTNFTEIYSDTINYSNQTITNIDINDDGFEDFLFSGYSWLINAPDAKVLLNNGDGTMTLVSAPAIIPIVNNGQYKSAMLDNSGKKHLVVIDPGFGYIIKNHGNGVFTQEFTLNDAGGYSHIAISDIDIDGLNDISIFSVDGSNDGTMLYKNLGNLDFESHDSVFTGLPNVWDGEIEYADFNGDQLPDAVIAAQRLNGSFVNKIYLQSDSFKFTGGEIDFTVQDEWGNSDTLYIIQGSVDIYDYNNDNRLDILFTGNSGVGAGPFALPRTWLMTNTSTLSIDEFQQASFTMYPNPARDIVSFKGIDTIKSVEVFSQLGQKVLSVQDTHSINIESLSTGMYLVQVQDANHRTFQKKLIKK